MYHKKAALYYDYFAGREDLPFFRRLMLRLGGPVLDMGCGTGSLTMDLAGAGITVVGVDNSPYMLDVARSKLDRLPPSEKERVQLAEGDMLNYEAPSLFNSILIARGSFGHLMNTEDQLRCLANMRKLLDVGGKLVLDLYPPALDFLQGGTSIGKSVAVDGDLNLLRTVHTRCDINTQRCSYTIIYEQFKGGVLLERVLEESSTSLLFPREALLLLRQCGYTIQDIYGDTAGGSFNSTSRRMIIVAGRD